jgi:hypothetical protein
MTIMKGNKISGFKNFMDVHYISEGKIETEPKAWDELFANMEDSKKDSGKTTSEGDLPDWAKKGLKLDSLKGKNADQRWDWLTNRINTVIKDKQASKVEEITNQNMGNLPGYRILWKEQKTETGDQQDNSGKEYKIYYTEIYKGNPGTWVDRKDDSGKPGDGLGKGYWGQNSRVGSKVVSPASSGATGATGATGSPSSSGVEGGILWVDEPPVQLNSEPGGFGDTKLIDLFADTDMGKAILGFLMNGEEFKNFEKTGKIEFTDSPPTSEEIDKGLTSDQKEVQKKNIEKLNSMGHKTVKPDYSLVTGPAEYPYKSSSLKMSWDDIKKGLDNSGASKNMDFDKMNIVGIRNSLAVKNQYQNRFTDLLVVMSPKDKKQVSIYKATTTPGIAFLYMPFRNWWMSSALKDTINPNGLGILQTGVYDYTIGSHRGKYQALIQGKAKAGRIKPVEKPQDLKFSTFTPSSIQEGNFGMNIHKAGKDTPSIDSWSAGCQVLKQSDDFDDMMEKARNSGQTSFKYALINSSDLEKGSKLA